MPPGQNPISGTAFVIEEADGPHLWCEQCPCPIECYHGVDPMFCYECEAIELADVEVDFGDPPSLAEISPDGLVEDVS